MPFAEGNGTKRRRTEADKTETILFVNVPVQTSIQSSRIDIIPSSTNLPSADPSLPIEFKVAGNSEEFLDPAIYLHLSFQVLKSDGTKLVKPEYDPITKSKSNKGDSVAPINFCIMTFWKEVELYMNNRLITTPPNTAFAYTSYLTSLMQYSKDMQETILQAGGFFMDSLGTLDVTSVAGANEGFTNRAAMVSESDVVDICGLLELDCLKFGRLLPKGVDLQFRLHRAPVLFALQADVDDVYNYKISIRKAELVVRRVTLTQSKMQQIDRHLQIEPAIFPFVRNITRVIPVPTNLRNIDCEVFDNVVPKRVIFAQVHSKAFNGSYKKNPFRFDSFKIDKISWYLNGNLVTGQSVPVNFETGATAYAYLTTMLNSMRDGDAPMNLTMDMFQSQFAIFIQDFTPDFRWNGDHVSPEQKGTLRLKIDYKEPLEAPIILLIVGEMEDYLTIDKHHVVRSKNEM